VIIQKVAGSNLGLGTGHPPHSHFFAFVCLFVCLFVSSMQDCGNGHQFEATIALHIFNHNSFLPRRTEYETGV
jgi:hypothetical protein